MPLLSQPRRLAEGVLLDRLHAIQKEHGYLPQSALKEAAQDLDVPFIQLYSAATFYAAFCFHPRGRHTIRVCMGTACHIRGGGQLLEKLEADLKVKAEETSSDGEFTLTTVRCVGSCGMSPVIQVDNDTLGRLRSDRLAGILKHYMPEEDADLKAKEEKG